VCIVWYDSCTDCPPRKEGTATAELQQAYERLLAVARYTQAQAVRVCAILQGQAGTGVERLSSRDAAQPRGDLGLDLAPEPE
jgi:hypothetical protein